MGADVQFEFQGHNSSAMMVGSHYISPSLSNSDSLSINSCYCDDCQGSGVPAAPSYGATTPYPEISPYSVPAQLDTSLLTPASPTSSLSVRRYSTIMDSCSPAQQDQDQSSSQAPSIFTPWSAPMQLNATPGQVAASVESAAGLHVGYIEAYNLHDRRTPEPPVDYLGNYGVSSNVEPPVVPSNGNPYCLPSNLTQPSAQLVARDGSLIDPSRPQPTPSQLNSLPNHPQAVGMTGQNYRFIDHTTGLPPQRRASSRVRLPDASSSRRGKPGEDRVKKTRRGKGKSEVRAADDQNAEASAENKNCFGEEVPPQLKDSCPEEERCIFESRWKHRNKKGQDMWDSILSDFEKQFNKMPGKEALQMKFKRGRIKFIDWLPRDIQILRDAWVELEQERYTILLNKFHEMGGSRNMLLNATDIQIKLVTDLRLESIVYEDLPPLQQGFRKRQRSSSKNSTKKNSLIHMQMRNEVCHPLEPWVLPDGGFQQEMLVDHVADQVWNSERARRQLESDAEPQMMPSQMWDEGQQQQQQQSRINGIKVEKSTTE